MNSTTLSATNKTQKTTKLLENKTIYKKNVRIIQKLLTKYIDYIMMKSRKVMVK